MGDWTAVVLTGGTSRRFGRDKITAELGGRRMIDHILDSIPAEAPVVVVGPDPLAQRPVAVTREAPPGGGPAAALAAGAAAAWTGTIAVLAGDMPFAVPALIELVDLLGPDDAVIPVADGRDQPLCAVYRTQAVRGARVEPGMSMRDLLGQLTVRRVSVSGRKLFDVDSEQDLVTARATLAILEDMDEWITAVKQALDLDADVNLDLILDVARDAAHGVERPAAPVTTYLLGMAVANGADPAAAQARIAELAQGWHDRG